MCTEQCNEKRDGPQRTKNTTHNPKPATAPSSMLSSLSRSKCSNSLTTTCSQADATRMTWSASCCRICAAPPSCSVPGACSHHTPAGRRPFPPCSTKPHSGDDLAVLQRQRAEGGGAGGWHVPFRKFAFDKRQNPTSSLIWPLGSSSMPKREALEKSDMQHCNRRNHLCRYIKPHLIIDLAIGQQQRAEGGGAGGERFEHRGTQPPFARTHHLPLLQLRIQHLREREGCAI